MRSRIAVAEQAEPARCTARRLAADSRVGRGRVASGEPRHTRAALADRVLRAEPQAVFAEMFLQH